MLAALTLEDFTPHLDTGFAVTVEGHDEVLTLVAATPSRHAVPDAPRHPFTLLFRGARRDLIIHPQILELRHPAFGVLAIDVVPCGRNDDGTHDYRAGFN